MEYKEIKERFDIAVKRWNEFRDEVDKSWDFNRPYGEYSNVLYHSKEYEEYSKWWDLEHLHRPVYNLKDPEQWEIEDCRMTIDEFTQACKYGMFTSNDGNGYYGTEDKISDIPICPETIIKMKRDDFTHIWWYNK